MDSQTERRVRLVNRALVVGVNRRARTQLSRWLTGAGYAVTVSGSFRNAVLQIRSRPLDLLVADVRLGEFNGLHLGNLVRHLQEDTRVVILSEWDSVDLRFEAARLGALYLVKPFPRAALLKAAEWMMSPARDESHREPERGLRLPASGPSRLPAGTVLSDAR